MALHLTAPVAFEDLLCFFWSSFELLPLSENRPQVKQVIQEQSNTPDLVVVPPKRKADGLTLVKCLNFDKLRTEPSWDRSMICSALTMLKCCKLRAVGARQERMSRGLKCSPSKVKRRPSFGRRWMYLHPSMGSSNVVRSRSSGMIALKRSGYTKYQRLLTIQSDSILYEPVFASLFSPCRSVSIVRDLIRGSKHHLSRGIGGNKPWLLRTNLQ